MPQMRETTPLMTAAGRGFTETVVALLDCKSLDAGAVDVSLLGTRTAQRNAGMLPLVECPVNP